MFCGFCDLEKLHLKWNWDWEYYILTQQEEVHKLCKEGFSSKYYIFLRFLFYPETNTSSVILDKTGGKKFSKEFEEASSKLEEFVNGLDKQVKNGPSLTEALENAGIFYEAQYKEVKVVANVSNN